MKTILLICPSILMFIVFCLQLKENEKLKNDLAMAQAIIDGLERKIDYYEHSKETRNTQ